jgi:hypothetical protein
MGYASVLNARPAWEDRFRQPSVDELRTQYTNAQVARLVDAARDRLLATQDVTEAVVWQGLPWRWTIVYRVGGDPTRALAYLVPDPAGPKVAVPLTAEMISAMPLRRMKKHIRDGLATGRRVGATVWATFDITSKVQLDEVLDLAKRKVKFISTMAVAAS